MAEDGQEFVRVAVGGLVKDQRNNPVVLLRREEGDEVLLNPLAWEAAPIESGKEDTQQLNRSGPNPAVETDS